MKADGLYKLQVGDGEKLKTLLAECFFNDPLYCELIPSEAKRKKMLPDIFNCEIEDLFENCEIYADSKDVNGIIVLTDETEEYNAFKYYLSELFYALKTGAHLIKDDLSLQTLRKFMQGRDFIFDTWTDRLACDNRLHINYFAVRPTMQGKGIASALMNSVLNAADKEGLATSLETHNNKNLSLYEHFGFEVFEVLQRKLKIKQYCMFRKTKIAS